MLKFVCLFALVAMACAAPRSYGYGDDENRDGVPDSLDANRDGKVDYGYGHGYARNSYGHDSYGYQDHYYGYVPYGDGYPYANVGPNGAVVKSPSGLIVGDNGGYINAQTGKVVGPNGYVAPEGYGYGY